MFHISFYGMGLNDEIFSKTNLSPKNKCHANFGFQRRQLAMFYRQPGPWSHAKIACGCSELPSCKFPLHNQRYGLGARCTFYPCLTNRQSKNGAQLVYPPGTKISPLKVAGKMMFLFHSWDMLVQRRVWISFGDWVAHVYIYIYSYLVTCILSSELQVWLGSTWPPKFKKNSRFPYFPFPQPPARKKNRYKGNQQKNTQNKKFLGTAMF